MAYFLRSHLGQIQFEKWFSGASGQIDIWPNDLNQFILPESSEKGVPLQKQVEIANRISYELDSARGLRDDGRNKHKKAILLFEKLLYET